jgi:hypothetical protein
LKNCATFQISALAFLFLSFLTACHGDRQESYYPSLAAAEKDGATTRGWIPGVFPASSRTIHEVHFLSPSTEWCSFEFSVVDSEKFRTSLKNAGAVAGPVPRVPKPGVPWWPPSLTGNLDMTRIHNEGLVLYRIEEPETSVTTEVLLFAIDWSKGLGYFYAAPKGE